MFIYIPTAVGRKSSKISSGAFLTMRDLVVKINTDHAVVVGGTTAEKQTSDDPLREDDGGDSSNGSDSGTAGTPTSQSFWPDLEVLDPDHPM